MTILFTIEHYLPNKLGGTEVYVRNLCEQLKKLGIQVAVLTSGYTDNVYQFENVAVYEIGQKTFKSTLLQYFVAIKPTILHLHSRSEIFNENILKIAQDKGIKTVFTTHLADLFCINNGALLKYGTKSCSAKVKPFTCLNCHVTTKLHKPFVFSFLVNILLFISIKTGVRFAFLPPYYWLAYTKKRTLKTLMHHTNLCIAIAPWVEAAFKINGAKKVTLIKQGVTSNDAIVPVQNKDFACCQFVFIGRFSEDKGVPNLLNILAKSEGDFHLTLIIATQDEATVLQAVEKCGVAKSRISLHFNLTKQDVSEVLKQAHYLCLLSQIRDTAPLVVLEAFQHKVPVVVSPNAASYVVDGEDGVIVNPNDFKTAVDTFSKIIQDENLHKYLQANITQPDSTFFVAKKHVAAYQSLF